MDAVDNFYTGQSFVDRYKTTQDEENHFSKRTRLDNYQFPEYRFTQISQQRSRTVISKRRAARTPLPCREATVLHYSKYKAKIDIWCCRATICGPKMSGPSYVAIQIQS